jgi:hypothetical protein
MKKLIFFACVALLANASFAQSPSSPQANSDVAAPTFDTQNFDFGKIKVGVPATHEFKFTNTGKVPMIITNVQASCGCTTPSWSKDPIPPGGQGYVNATYNAAGVGTFDKTVTVTANVQNGTILLRIHGEVVQPVQ